MGALEILFIIIIIIIYAEPSGFDSGNVDLGGECAAAYKTCLIDLTVQKLLKCVSSNIGLTLSVVNTFCFPVWIVLPVQLIRLA